MPIYDYVCSNCGHLTEVVHGINDSGPKFCPECGAEATMTKAFTLPAIHFKGSGWAKKDRSASSRSSSKKDEAATTASGTGGADATSPSESSGSKTDTGAPGSSSSSTSPSGSGSSSGD
ncbi:MAG: FmdB family zinc ribbon protein [Chloroflexota bacterium]